MPFRRYSAAQLEELGKILDDAVKVVEESAGTGPVADHHREFLVMRARRARNSAAEGSTETAAIWVGAVRNSVEDLLRKRLVGAV